MILLFGEVVLNNAACLSAPVLSDLLTRLSLIILLTYVFCIHLHFPSSSPAHLRTPRNRTGIPQDSLPGHFSPSPPAQDPTGSLWKTELNSY